MTGLLEMDGNLLIDIQQFMIRDWLTPIVTFITHLGNVGMIWIIMILLLLVYKKTRTIGLTSAGSLLLSFIINNLILKNLFDRMRPYDAVEGVMLLVERQSDASFPSGHAAAAFSTAVALYILLPRKYGIPILIFAFLIGLSRLYVGVHYPSDVLAGAVSGSICAVIACYASRAIQKRIDDRGEAV